jgi:hypothetical protein
MKTLAGGRIETLTYKEGLLSKVAHDLLLELERFEVASDGARVEGKFWPASFHVEGVMHDGARADRSLSDRDTQEIVDNIRHKILHTEKFPEATFSGRAERGEGRHRVEGTLSLVGETQEIRFDVIERDGHWRGEVELRPSRWGIAPFKALLGAIKLQDRVVVRFDFPVVEL